MITIEEREEELWSLVVKTRFIGMLKGFVKLWRLQQNHYHKSKMICVGRICVRPFFWKSARNGTIAKILTQHICTILIKSGDQARVKIQHVLVAQSTHPLPNFMPSLISPTRRICSSGYPWSWKYTQKSSSFLAGAPAANTVANCFTGLFWHCKLVELAEHIFCHL